MNLLLLLGCFQSWTVTSDCVPVERFLDEDGDGYGSESLSACPGEHPARFGAELGGDCDDGDVQVNPAQAELCEGLDNDCDGEVDEGVFVDFYADADGDGFGSGDPVPACTDDPPFVPAATQGDDCLDSDASVYPGADELCNGLDNDCDGTADNDPVSGPTWYADADADGFGDSSTAQVACTQPTGTVSVGSDCDDAQVSVYPGALEVCGDGMLNDCEGSDDCRLAGSERLSNWTYVMGAVLGEGLGSSLNSGDLSGDGVADLSAAVSPLSEVGGVAVSYDFPSVQQTLYYHQSSNTGFGVHDIGDMTGDGQVDLAVAAESYGVAYLFEGPLPPGDSYIPHSEALGTFKFDPQSPGKTQILILEDMTGDGEPELALAEGSNEAVTLLSGLWQAGSGHELDNTLASLVGSEANTGMAMEGNDMNGDGLADLSVLSRRYAYLVETAQLTAVADLEDCSTILDSDGSRFTDLSLAGDATGSGDQALWVSTSSDEVGLWRGETAWGTLPIRLSLEGGYQLQGPISGGQDMDGDGEMDLAFSVIDATGESGVCFSYGPFKAGVLTPDYCGDEKGSSQAGADVLLTADLNGDGVPDLATSDPSAAGAEGLYYLLFGASI